MDHDGTNKRNSTGKLRASITKDYRINTVDLFADYNDTGSNFRIIPERINSLSDLLVFLSSPPSCPLCNQPKLTLNERWCLKEWFLKLFGRRIFHCSNCDWKQTVKLHQWERETIITAIAVALIIFIYSANWFLFGR
jgi:hypothetical protein